MNMIKRQILLSRNKKVNILLPLKVCPDITATDDGKGYYCLCSNKTGYSILNNVFALATSLEKEELIHYPLAFAHKDAYISDFPAFENHYKGIVIFNFNTTKISAKDISTALKIKTYKDEELTRQNSYSKDFPAPWKIWRKLTIKSSGKLLIISGNREVFTSMAQSCANLSEYGNDTQYNIYRPHMHHDGYENTAKSMGITFEYWHSGKDDKAK